MNPRRAATRTRGTAAATEPATRPASEIKTLVRALDDFTQDELAEVPVVEPGSRLRPRAIYVDLGDERRRPFKASDEAVAADDAFYVAKASVARPLWNRLMRVEGAERVRRGDAGTRRFPQGENEQRGGRERSERRGAGAVGSARGSARHPRARPH